MMTQKLLPIIFLGLLQTDTTFAETAKNTFRIFVPNKRDKEISQFIVHKQGQRITIEDAPSLPLSFEPATATIHPNKKHLIITNSGKDTPTAASAEITKNGNLQLINSSPLDQPSGYTSIDRSGRFFMTAHYRSGSLSTYKIEDNGKIGKATFTIKTPLKEAHCILTTPDNRFAYIPCVKNNNAIFQYAFNAETGHLTPLTPFDAKPPAMFGPRHIAYHPKLPIAYFSNEQQLGVSAYKIGKDGQLSDIQHATTIARRHPFEKGKRSLHASDILLSHNGKHLFIALRDFISEEDSIFTFRIEADGRLSQTARTPVGDIPWKLALSPDGHNLLVSEITESTLSIFTIQPNGSLTLATKRHWCPNVRDFAVISAPLR